MTETVVLVKSNNETGSQIKYALRKEAACMSGVLKNMLDDALVQTQDEESSILLPNVPGDALGRVVAYCEHHWPNPPEVYKEDPDKPQEERDATIYDAWDKGFIDAMDLELRTKTLLAANYMEIPPLIELLCKAFANMMEGKTTEELRATFNIENDFTPEEEKQVRFENSWFER